MRRAHITRLAVAVLLLAGPACGHRMSRADILKANALKVRGEGASAATGNGSSTDLVASSGDLTNPAADTTGAGSNVGSAAGLGATSGGGAPSSAGSPAASSISGSTGGASAGITTPGETGPIIIGSVGTYSGVAGTSAVDQPKAIQVWVSRINSGGGLFGRRVEFIVVDDQNDPAKHQAALRDLVENRHVVAFVGNYAPITAPAGRAYLEQRKVPAIGTDCNIDLYEKSPVYFTQCGPANFAYLMPLHANVKFGSGRKLGVLYCAEAAICTEGNNAVKAGATKTGMSLVYDAQVSLVQPDFTSECINARSAGANVIFPFVDPNGFTRIAASCLRQGYKPQFIAGGNVAKDASSKPGLENIIVGVPVFPFIGGSTPQEQEFYKLWAQLAGGVPGPSGATGWVAAKLFELAATRAAVAAGSISAKTLIDALHTVKGETLGDLTVPLDFTGPGFKNPACYWAMQGTGNGWRVLGDGKQICP